jgi:uncharacterized protein YraI
MFMQLSTKLIAGGLAAAALLATAGAALADPGTATASVNVRSGPGTSYSIVDALYPGENVDIRNCQGGWCYVVHSGPDGWVSANYLEGAGGYYEPAPVYVEPAPIYTPSPTIIVRPPYHHYRHRGPDQHHQWPGNHPWPGNQHDHNGSGNDHHPDHPWTGKPPTGMNTGHQHPPHVSPGPKAGTGNGGNFCQINPDVCKPHHRGH